MFQEILSRLASSLKGHSLPYMIIGGQAILLYGEPRLTRDIDVTLSVNTNRLVEFLAVIKDRFLTLPETKKEKIGFKRESES